jgi:hypothetical protein
MIAVFLLGGWEIILILGVFLIPVVLLCFAFWIWMLIDCIKNENLGGNEKVAWVIAIVLTHFLGALIYFFAGRKRNTTMPARG